MTELLSLSVGIGLVVGMLFTELFGIASGGLIVPGYVALYLNSPWDVAITVAVALATFGIVRALTSFMIIYGRRRSALMILIGYLLGMAVRQWLQLPMEEFTVIGFVIPGLIAIWMDRQGVLQTMASMLIVASCVRLILILTAGPELLT
ncbi:MAG: poly-gamma-glutamate biosynthesis protein PgsC [Candidatus Lernaella stagnicola]|nr:poly-gamma-glutamate biosynthesis protein PgsC [Candidatus Lernaella stagnicola]